MTHQDEPEIGRHSIGDEFELRVEALREPSTVRERSAEGKADRSINIGIPGLSHATPVASRRRRSRIVRLALFTVVLVTVVTGVFAVVRGDLGGIHTPQSANHPPAAPVPRATPTPTPILYPTPTVGQGIPTALGPAPTACAPPAPVPQTIAYGFERAIGATPVWVARFDGPRATKHIEKRVRYTRYGWPTAMIVAVEPGLTDPVVLRGVRLDDGEPLWMAALDPGQTFKEATPMVAVVLDPQQPGLADYHNTSMGLSEDWAAWDAMFYIPAAGCYALEATWPGGSWRVTFAAGR